MASTVTPASGTIKISDLDKSITRNWVGNSTSKLAKLETQDFFDGDPNNQDIGFAYCYGTPGTSTPHKVSDYYDILGWVDYRAKAIGVGGFNPGGIITVDVNPMNGSNGTAPQQLILAEPTEIPTGEDVRDGAAFDVYFDGNYIDTITRDGIYVYDNGGTGYTNGAGTYVDIAFQ
jgi:hypothetical protein